VDVSKCGMVLGMATTRKVTVTLPADAVETIRGLIASGKADSVSGFVQHAVQVSLDDITGWGAMLAQALEETGGDLTPEERAWASDVLGIDEPSNVA
jgi:Arc/MetJ-type ribon-helix-helix transcriptional regulator